MFFNAFTVSLHLNIIKSFNEYRKKVSRHNNWRNIDGSICKYFVICQGNSPQQVEAIAGSVSDYVREYYGEKPINCTGLGTNQWVAIDYADVLVHIFIPQTRAYYDLEHLWEDATLTQIADLD